MILFSFCGYIDNRQESTADYADLKLSRRSISAGIDSTVINRRYKKSRALLNRRADFVAPFGPRPVVIAHVIEAEQIGEDEPGVTGAFANSAIHDGVGARFHAALIEINF